MGLTYVHARLRKAEGRGATRDVRFLINSGAIFPVLPEEVWRALRLKSQREVEFTLADGTAITRGVSECRIEIRGASATSPVVLGETDDGALLGAVTLETLGMMLNPLTRKYCRCAWRCHVCDSDCRSRQRWLSLSLPIV